ncbi:hypothetical protein OROMI_016951 [Orobanche minor]
MWILIQPLISWVQGSTKRIIDDDSGLRMRPMTGMIDMKSSMSMDKKAPGRASETKRTRRIPEEMEKIMFKLFERQPNWTLKQLIQQTYQPEVD